MHQCVPRDEEKKEGRKGTNKQQSVCLISSIFNRIELN